jgi:tungstate transport system permease protein
LNDLRQAFVQALSLIASADRDFLTIISASLRFSISSTLLATAIGLPVGVVLANARFPFKRLVEDILNTFLAIPTVVVGLFAYTLIFSQGPLGRFHLLFTPGGIIFGQTLVNPVVRQTALTLGAGKFQASCTVASETKAALLVVCLTAFGRVIGEIGISLLLGGNILGYTRTITTAISLQTSRGEFALGLALGITLLCVAFGINIAMRLLRTRS